MSMNFLSLVSRKTLPVLMACGLLLPTATVKAQDEPQYTATISAATNPTAELAMQQLDKLRGSEAHSSVILSSVDVGVFRKLGINLTCEPRYQSKKLYHK